MSVNEKMTAIADAIRAKTGETGKLSLDAMAQKIRQLEAGLVNTVTGNPISLTDSLDWKLRGLKLFGKTTQNGTPTPDAPVPLVSAGDGGSLGVTVAGKNLLPFPYYDGDSHTHNGVTYSVNSDGSVHVSGTAVNGKSTFHFNPYSGRVRVPCGNLTVWNGLGNSSGVNVQFDMYQDDVYAGTLQTGGNGTAITNTFIGKVELGAARITVSVGVTADCVVYPQLEAGTAHTEYEPYKEPQTLILSTPNALPGIPVSSGGNYNDETGQQWVCDEVDFARGVYVQRVAVQHITSVKDTNNVAYWKDNISQFMGNFTEGNADRTKPTIVSHGVNGGWFDSSVFYASLANNVVFIVGGNRQKFGDTAESCNAYLAELNAVSPVQMLYALETPIETPLSAEELAAYAALHTNYPNTTIYNDGGAGMEVKYVADTKLYIDNKINAMAAAIVNA